MTPPLYQLLPLLLLLCLPLLSESKRSLGQVKPVQHRQPPPPPVLPSSPPPLRRPRTHSVPGSGELTTRGGHRCTWRTSGEGLVSLMVNCSTEEPGAPQRYWCRFSGRPDLCRAYGSRSSQFWKLLVAKLKKRQRACEGERVLRTRTCKKGDAHMKLVQHGGGEEGGGAVGGKRRREEEEERRRGLEGGVVNDMVPVQSYCGDGWNAVCSFLVKFFEG